MAFSKLAVAATVLFSLASSISAKLSPVSVKGNAFFRGTERFYIRGLAYQPGGAADAADPLLDITSLKRDIEQFKTLGVNTIRVYTVDNAKNHDEAMKLLDDAGIYLALDTNTPKYSLNRANLASLHASYNDVYLQSVFSTVDAFASYSNLLLFFSGNEVINERNNTNAAPYIKAVTRDMKQYISNRHDRLIPVGYSSADVAENIEQQALYFNCGSNDERSDFFAFNDYSWCDPSSFTQSGWDRKVRTYSNYSIPLFLSEFGCITNRRDWGEIGALYSTNMTSVYSGGLVYEYSMEENKYGLVDIKDNGQLEITGDFTRLSAAYSKTANPTGDGGYNANGAASNCPAASDEWDVPSTLLPAMPVPAKKFMTAGAGTGPGLSGEGSQWHGTPSESEAQVGSGQPSVTPSGSSPSSTATTTGGSGGSTGAAAGVLHADVAWKAAGAVMGCIALGAGLLL